MQYGILLPKHKISFDAMRLSVSQQQFLLCFEILLLNSFINYKAGKRAWYIKTLHFLREEEMYDRKRTKISTGAEPDGSFSF